MTEAADLTRDQGAEALVPVSSSDVQDQSFFILNQFEPPSKLIMSIKLYYYTMWFHIIGVAYGQAPRWHAVA